MKRWVSLTAALALAFLGSPAAQAFDTVDSEVVTVSASGSVDSTVSFDVTTVAQGSGDPGTPATLDFEAGDGSFRDSEEAVRIAVNTNLAGNRVIVYTDNLSGGASPQFQGNTANGIDGGGLVGVSDSARNVPLLFVVLDTNADHSFTTGTIGDDETFLTDRAHVATFTAVDSLLDNQNVEACDGGATLPVPVNNTDSDGLYSQYFGTNGENHDMCLVAGGAKVPEAEELAKNIAVVAFGFSGTAGTANNLSSVTSPIFLPLGADFTGATAQNYGTNTLTFELVTQ